MPREHGRLRVSINQDEDFTDLPELEQWLYMRLLARPDINQAGVLPLSLRKWARMSRHATVESVQESAEFLADRHYLVLDYDTEEALVRSFIRNDDVWRQPHVLMSACVSAMGVESKAIRAALAAEIAKIRGEAVAPLKDKTRQRLEPKIDEALRALAPDGPRDPSRNPRPNPSPNPSNGTLPEPFGEGLWQPITEPPGEGEGEGVPPVGGPYIPTSPSGDEEKNPDVDTSHGGRKPASDQRRGGKPRATQDSDPMFDAFWAVWPRKQAKEQARKKFAALVARGTSAAAIITAAEAQAMQWKHERKEVQFIPYASTWLHQRRFKDEIEKPGLRVVSDSPSPWGVYDVPESPWAQSLGGQR